MGKIAKRWDRHRRARALRKINKLRRLVDPLGHMRQFLYLDNIALRSLYVSRYGPEDARITLTDSQTRDDGLSGNFGPSSAGFGLSWRDGVSKTMQIERIASEQSLFRDFLERELSIGSMSQIWDGTPDSRGVLSAKGRKFKRGDLVLVRIRLQADRIFQIVSFASAILELTEGGLGKNLPNKEEVLQIVELLQKLLIEQAPIDSELTDWGWDNVTQTVVLSSDVSESLRLVGLTQIENYWLDVRRVLFDHAECTALVRITEDIPSIDWSPLKLFDAARGIPGLENLNDSINQITTAFDLKPNLQREFSFPVGEVLTKYVHEIAPTADMDALRQTINGIVADYKTAGENMTALSNAFGEVDRLLKFSGAELPEPDIIAKARDEMIASLELEKPDAQEAIVSKIPVTSNDKFMVGEIIALYW